MHRHATAVVSLNFIAWGTLPLFWKLLEHVNSSYVLAHRIIWAAVFSGLWLLLMWVVTPESRRVKRIFHGISSQLVFSSIVIAANWGIYIWAVNNGFVSYAALGYFVAPLLSVCLGLACFREPVSGLQWISIVLTAGGAVVYGWGHSGVGLLVVFGVAITFSVYGAIKKMVKVDAVPGMFTESSVLAPAAIVLIFTGVLDPGGRVSEPTWVLLAISGLVTVVPLIILSYYARFVPLSALGMLQFLLPVVQLTLGVAVFGEVVSGVQTLALLGIVTGVALYLFDTHRFRIR